MLRNKEAVNRYHASRLTAPLHISPKYTEKQIMIVVQAAPKTHPGGVHGAF